MQPIEIKTRAAFSALLEHIGDVSLPADYFVVAGDGKTYFKSDVENLSEPPFNKKYPNLPLRNVLENAALRKAIITGEPPSAVEKEAVHALFRCPIALEITPLSAITPSGQAYDQQRIHEAIAISGPHDPNTRLPLSHADLAPNEALRDLLFLYAQTDNSVLEVVKERLSELRATVQETQTRINEIEKEVQKYKRLRVGGILGIVSFYATGWIAVTLLRNYISDKSGPYFGAGLVLGLFSSVLCTLSMCSGVNEATERLEAERHTQEAALSARQALLDLEYSQFRALLEQEEVVIEIGEAPVSLGGRNPLRFFVSHCCCADDTVEEAQRLLPEHV